MSGPKNSPDQCPSTKGKQQPAKGRDLPREASMPGAPKVWRSPEEIADTAEFRDLLEREFPAGASELATENRRDFMKFMAAGLALAGAATVPGCRRPDHKIFTYSSEVPEDSIPGKPLFFATSMPLPGGGAEGLLVETHDGRPTKIEGNPLHPNNRGKSSALAQASILGIYDPDRLKYPTYNNPSRGRLQATWDDYRAWHTEHFAGLARAQGAGMAVVLGKVDSPTRDAQIQRVRNRFPQAQIVFWEATDAGNEARGTAAAFGEPRRASFRFGNAKVVVSVGSNFMVEGPDALTNARDFAATRRVWSASDEMSRLYAVESGFSETGSMADHRLRLAPSRHAAFLVLLGRELVKQTEGGAIAEALRVASVSAEAAGDIDASFVEAVAEDLLANRGAALVAAGPSLPAHAHALAAAINDTIGALGATVVYKPISDQQAADSYEQMRALAADIDAGRIGTLVCLSTNPAYDAPGELGFESLMGRVANTVTLSVPSSETAAASTWALNGAHFLESWGDTLAADGTIAPQQPMIAPLYGTAPSDIEMLAMLAGDPEPSGYELTRAAWQQQTSQSGDAFDKTWRRALHDGVLAGSGARNPATGSVDYAGVRDAVQDAPFPGAPGNDTLDVEFITHHVHDGRFAGNAWLQELPQAATRVVWDNPALMSPATAERLRVQPVGGSEDPYTGSQLPKARMAEFTVNGRTVQAPVWVMPGMADNTVLLALGYGRRESGRVGTGVGFDMNTVRPASGAAVVSGASASRVGGRYEIVSTQNHWSLESRTSIVRQIDKKYWEKYGDKDPKVVPDKIYGAAAPAGAAEAQLNLAEQMGELSHTPANISLYTNPYNMSKGDADPNARQNPDGLQNNAAKALNRPVPAEFAQGPQWGMSVDQSTCSGCGACVIACQAENNIPVVGKREVAKGREMHWIRVDRYYIGDDLNNPEQMVHQTVMCVHCENAPCEVVCPVNATVHGPEGTNDMVYNRCIGTRYCSNNCPYKVRRFNFFDYSQAKYNGGTVDGLEFLDGVPNQNFIPPRLRKQLDEIQKMKMNPDVTVRSRGVMEKCTYCIQRVNAARYEMKLQDLDAIPDGFVQTACQQSCPSSAITFGDILDESSAATRERENNRSYLLLGYLNTRPRTTHLLRVNNPNPKLRESVDPLHHGSHGGGHDDSHGDDHSGDHGDDHAFFDPRQKRNDGGYAMSLKVLASPAGVMA